MTEKSFKELAEMFSESLTAMRDRVRQLSMADSTTRLINKLNELKEGIDNAASCTEWDNLVPIMAELDALARRCGFGGGPIHFSVDDEVIKTVPVTIQHFFSIPPYGGTSYKLPACLIRGDEVINAPLLHKPDLMSILTKWISAAKAVEPDQFKPDQPKPDEKFRRWKAAFIAEMIRTTRGRRYVKSKDAMPDAPITVDLQKIKDHVQQALALQAMARAGDGKADKSKRLKKNKLASKVIDDANEKKMIAYFAKDEVINAGQYTGARDNRRTDWLSLEAIINGTGLTEYEVRATEMYKKYIANRAAARRAAR